MPSSSVKISAHLNRGFKIICNRAASWERRFSGLKMTTMRRVTPRIIDTCAWRRSRLMILPPTAGYLDGEHVTLRQKLGILTSDPEEEDANDLEWQNRVLDTVRKHGDFDGTPANVSYDGLARDERPDSAAIIAGLHKFLAESPAAVRRTRNAPRGRRPR